MNRKKAMTKIEVEMNSNLIFKFHQYSLQIISLFISHITSQGLCKINVTNCIFI